MNNSKVKSDQLELIPNGLAENPLSQKLRGGYYTPRKIVEFLCTWGITESTLKVLEPSCGDGNFVEASIRRFNELGIVQENLAGRVKGIELIPEEAQKATRRAKDLGLNSTTIVNSDFFRYVTSNAFEKFDLVLGNPPFIRYQNFPEEHRKLAIEMMQKLNLTPNKLTNIWVPFLVISASLLKDDGKLAMVIPAELFQVKYAAETRIFLSQYFQRITIITFKKLVFSDIQQEVVLLLGERKVISHSGIRVIECNSLLDLDKLDFESINGSNVKLIDHASEKWTKYFLNEDEIDLLKRLKGDARIQSCGEIMEVDVGLVTGRNEFFLLNESQVSAWKLRPYILPVISKSNQLKGISLVGSDIKASSLAGGDIYLFAPPNKDFDQLPKTCQKYIRFGEKKGYHKGYKCRIRKRWYVTPSIWNPDGFALRQVSDYPKIILNKTQSPSTDTIHRVRFRQGVDRKIVPILFLNSLTFAFSEITGRSYGGGVLTFEPSEIEELRIPRLQEVDVDFNEINKLIRQRKIDSVLDIIDQQVLVRALGLSPTEISKLRNIWKKLSVRRMHRARN